jgi:hypothetical protein
VPVTYKAVPLSRHALANNLSNFLRTLALPGEVERWLLTSLREQVMKIGAKVVAHGRYLVFQMAEVAVPQELFRRILDRIADLRSPAAARCRFWDRIRWAPSSSSSTPRARRDIRWRT